MNAASVFDPKDFADISFANECPLLFDEYVELRVKGYPRDLAIIEAFDLIGQEIETRNAGALGFAADCNPYVKARFIKVLAEKVVKKDLWTENIAVHELLQLVRNPSVRDTTRLNAINALNVLCGYVQLDEATKRRIGHTLADFAKLDADWQAGCEGGDGQVH